MDATIQLTGRLDPRSEWKAQLCSIGRALDVVRNRASVLILREAFYGATRFEEFAERTRLSEPVTSARLRELTAEGILQREPYRDPGQRTRHAYRLTEKGADLLPVLVALMEWGDRWQQDGEGGPIDLIHADCGGHLSLELRCEHDHAVGGDEVAAAPGARYQRR
jgi:DNA-binding HxlR family transcriptional regulator